MKIIKIDILNPDPTIQASADYEVAMEDIDKAVRAVVNPAGSNGFSIYPEKMGNGVKPIKIGCITSLQKNGWLEERNSKGQSSRKGAIDAVKPLSNGKYFALEWETGNISSSHRAMNKMCLGIMAGDLIGGMLVLPTRKLYQYLTDRVGNYEELLPYFPIWRDLPLPGGVLGIVAIEYDAVDQNAPRIAKGTDGRALG